MTMTNRDTTPTIIPPRRDSEQRAYERLAAAHPDRSVYVDWRRLCERVAILSARVALRNRYARRANALAIACSVTGTLPASGGAP